MFASDLLGFLRHYAGSLQLQNEVQYLQKYLLKTSRAFFLLNSKYIIANVLEGNLYEDTKMRFYHFTTLETQNRFKILEAPYFQFQRYK